MKEVFILDNAPVSEPGIKAILSQPGIYLTNGKEMTIDVVNGEYILDEKDAGRRQMLKDSLLKAGFRSAAIYPDEEPDKPAEEKPKKKAEKFEHSIMLMHPDNAPGNLINARVSAAGKKVKIVDGIVETDNSKVFEALLKKGFIVQNPHTLERETGEESHVEFFPPEPDTHERETGDDEEPIILDDVPDPGDGPGADCEPPDVVVTAEDGEEEPDGTNG